MNVVRLMLGGVVVVSLLSCYCFGALVATATRVLCFVFSLDLDLSFSAIASWERKHAGG